MALTEANRRLRLLVSTRRDIKFPTNPRVKDRQYMMVRAMVLGSCRVQSTVDSGSPKSFGEKVEKGDGEEEEEYNWWEKVGACWKVRVEVTKGEEMREEGSSEGRGCCREPVDELRVEGSMMELWKMELWFILRPTWSSCCRGEKLASAGLRSDSWDRSMPEWEAHHPGFLQSSLKSVSGKSPQKQIKSPKLWKSLEKPARYSTVSPGSLQLGAQVLLQHGCSSSGTSHE